MVLRRAAARLPRLLAGLRSLENPSPAACSAEFSTSARSWDGAGQSRNGFMAWLPPQQQLGRVVTPLSQPLPGVEPELPSEAPAAPPPTEITVLDNGIKIISEASPGPTASLGMYINSGSIYETPETSGCTALLECLAFKSTKHRPSLRIMKEVETFGNSIVANASREQMTYTVDCLKTGFPASLEILLDCVLNPAFEEQEVEDQKARLRMLLSSKDIHATIMTELLTRGAYATSPYGNPLIPDPEAAAAITPDSLRGFVSRMYRAPHMVLAAAGVDHAELVRLARPMLEHLPKADAIPEPKPRYSGTTVHLAGSYPQPNLLLAFEYRGGWRNVQGAVVMTVLNYLLGGGNSFSSGGPGKGMHSRLYTRVLNKYAWVHSCSAFNSTLNESGLFGIQASCEPLHVTDMLSVMCQELEAVEKYGTVRGGGRDVGRH